MTERSPGAPNPAEPSRPRDVPAPGCGPPAPADLNAVRRTDAIIDAMAARRAAGSAPAEAGRGEPARGEEGRFEPDPVGTAPPETAPAEFAPAGTAPAEFDRVEADESDPAVRLLHALISDVEDPAPSAGPPAGPIPTGPGPRRRGPRTIVALGVAGAVLASTGVAAAGSGVTDRSSAAAPTTPGPSDGAGAPRDAGDAVSATYERPAPPASRPDARTRPAATEPASPAPSADHEFPDGDAREFKERLERFLAGAGGDDGPGRPDPGGTGPSTGASGDGEARDGEPPPTIEELRERARERWNHFLRHD